MRTPHHPAEPLRIPTNRLLAGPEPGMALDEALAFATMATLAGGLGLDRHAEGVANAAALDEATLRRFHRLWGEPGLGRVLRLAMSHPAADFARHQRVQRAMADLVERGDVAGWRHLLVEDASMPAGTALHGCNDNVLQPSLSRKLFNAGHAFGAITYGLGGPRILVSHPFRGADGELYGAYENSLDLALALVARGYHGRMLFLDNLLALNEPVAGVPAWLLWFSLIAAHADLVVFVTVARPGLSPAQTRELAMTPARVHRVRVTVAEDELAPVERVTPERVVIIGERGRMSPEELRAVERERMGAMPLVRQYAQGSAPRDAIFVIDEQGHLAHHPADVVTYA